MLKDLSAYQNACRCKDSKCLGRRFMLIFWPDFTSDLQVSPVATRFSDSWMKSRKNLLNMWFEPKAKLIWCGCMDLDENLMVSTKLSANVCDANQLQTSSSTRGWGGGGQPAASLPQANNAAGLTLAVHPKSRMMKASQPRFSAVWTLDPAHMWHRHLRVIKRNEWSWCPSFSSKLSETDSSD